MYASVRDVAQTMIAPVKPMYEYSRVYPSVSTTQVITWSCAWCGGQTPAWRGSEPRVSCVHCGGPKL